MPVNITRRVNRETGKGYQEGAAQMPKWNFVAMGQVGLTGWTRVAAQPVARASRPQDRTAGGADPVADRRGVPRDRIDRLPP